MLDHIADFVPRVHECPLIFLASETSPVYICPPDSVKLPATEMGETRPFPEATPAGAPNKLPSGASARGQEPLNVESPCPESGVPGLCSHRQPDYNYLVGWPRCWYKLWTFNVVQTPLPLLH